MDDLSDLIARVAGAKIDRIAPLTGGCVGEVYRVYLADGRSLVAKTGQRGDPLDIEGWMLLYLREHSALPVPEIVHAEDRLLVMTYIDGEDSITAAAETHAAELLAALHDITSDSYGLERDTVIGGLRQPNPGSPGWIEFFRDQRLMYMGREAMAAGRLDPALMARLESLAARLDEFIEEPAAPSLIHGDMWGGNLLVSGDRIAGFVDPAIYFADAEIELAFSTMFSTFGEAFFRRYEELRPIRPFSSRRGAISIICGRFWSMRGCSAAATRTRFRAPSTGSGHDVSFLDHIAACNAHDLSGFLPFVVGGVRVGWVRRDFAGRLGQYPSAFAVSGEAVTLAPGLDDYASRSAAVDTALRALADDGTIPGWRGEYYPVGVSFEGPHLMEMERAAVPFFGIRAYGVHVNGFVRDGDDIRMWVARRARGKQTYPGMLDNMIAGGQPVGISPGDNLVKEAWEEASVPGPLAATARPVGTISYCMEGESGLKPDLMFNYDLRLPADFTPANTDGEVEEFYLWPIERVLEIVAESFDFKFNCNLVIIDFAIRHGLIGPEHPDYVSIAQGLRR